MKIYDRNLTGTSAAETGRTQESQNLSRTGTAKSAGGAGGSNDRVEFSGGLSQLSRTLSTFQSGRASRVQALAAAYQNGSYRVDAAATSRSMVSDALSAGMQ